MEIVISKTDSVRDFEAALELVTEYGRSLSAFTCSARFERHVDELRLNYSRPYGLLLLAWADGSAAGCIGMRPVDSRTCEMYRLYVRPQFRGSGTGQRLVDRLLEEAAAQHFDRMRLHTLRSLDAAVRLYRRIGFIEIDPYEEKTDDDQLFMSMDLI